MVLNTCRIRSGSLYPSIGLHVGCVLFVRTVGLFVVFFEKNQLLLSTKKVYDGALGWFFLVLIGFILWKWLSPEPPVDLLCQKVELQSKGSKL
jgi:hypothetical protein